jgi:hypothetical protein
MWLLGLVPLTLWAVRRWSALRLQLVGSALMVVGVVGLAVIVGREALYWLPQVPEEDRRFLPQRILYALAVATECPVLQLIACGMVCWLAGRRRAVRSAPPW